jgi:hypothetical protein
VLLYVDDVLVISERREGIIQQEIGKCFILKSESVDPSTLCLGGHMRQVILSNGVQLWAFGS